MRELDQDELIDQWTLVGDELELVSGKRGATRLGFALVLRFYTERGRFPRGRGEIPDAAVEYVARQVGVIPTDIAFYEWSGRTIEYHRAQIRKALGFRECSVTDAEAAVEWLVANVTQVQRGVEAVRDRLSVWCRAERIEPPPAGRIERIVRSALSRGEEMLFARVAARLDEPVKATGYCANRARAWAKSQARPEFPRHHCTATSRPQPSSTNRCLPKAVRLRLVTRFLPAPQPR